MRKLFRRPCWRVPLGILVVASAVMGPATAAGQAVSGDVGRILGRVIDGTTGKGLNSVTIEITGTALRVSSGVDGYFVLGNVPSGTVSISARIIGYGAKTVTGVVVPAQGSVSQDITLDPAAVQIAAISVSASAENGSVARALDQQRTATGILSSVTAEQISRSPDDDAAAVIRRVSGVTLDGGTVNMRGLGSRYTQTALNGARIPSPDPERKSVPLDMFPAGLLQTITTSKTFTPDQPGDFSGAQVNIQTKEFPAERSMTYSMSFGFNNRATGQNLFSAPTAGSEWLGFGDSGRALPSIVRSAGDFQPPPTQSDVDNMVAAFRNVWSPQQSSGSPSGSAGISVGGTDGLFGHPLSYLFSGTYSRGQGVRDDEMRSTAIAGESGTTLEIDRYEGQTGIVSVLWGGLANLSTLLGEHSRLSLNTTYNRTSDNEARFEAGTSEQFSVPFQIQRLQFVTRSVYSTQLKGEHEYAGRHRSEWLVTLSGVTRDEPDRSEIVYAVQTDPLTGDLLAPMWYSGSSEGAVRTFAALEENGAEFSFNHRVEIGDQSRPHTLKLGASIRSARRDAENLSYGISTSGLGRNTLELAPEEIFSQYVGTGGPTYRVAPLGAGGSYTAEDQLEAAYGMMEIALGERVRVIGGARVEHQKVEVAAHSTLGDDFLADPEYTDVLPALAINVQLSDDHVLRISGSQTLSRPEYRELAGVKFREVIEGEQVSGNPNLERTLIQNADVRWEWYPTPTELVSVALFAKSFDAPIERIYRATSGTRIVRFVNAEEAQNYGVEFEVRKRLGGLNGTLEPITAFANVTLMKSDITIGASEASTTNDQRAMVGQAPYVVNAGLSYTLVGTGTSATLLYNVVGRRILNAGELPLPDVYEEERHVLDLSLRFDLMPGVSGKVDAKNLLDSAYELTQGTVTRSYYRMGRVLSVGLSLKR